MAKSLELIKMQENIAKDVERLKKAAMKSSAALIKEFEEDAISKLTLNPKKKIDDHAEYNIDGGYLLIIDVGFEDLECMSPDSLMMDAKISGPKGFKFEDSSDDIYRLAGVIEDAIIKHRDSAK